MKITKHLVTAAATVALATSMTCIAPVAAQAAPVASGDAVVSTTTGSSFAPMATSTTKGTVKANEKRELEFYLKKNNIKKKIKPSKIKWSTSNAKIATVKKGIMTTKKEGKVTITAKYQGHTILYKITVKGDARFDVAVKTLKNDIIAGAGYQASYAQEEKYYENSATKDGMKYTLRYSATYDRFTAIYENNGRAAELVFSAKYKNKECTITGYRGADTIGVKTMKKSAYKSSEDCFDFNTDLNPIVHDLMSLTNLGVSVYGLTLKDFGFTNFNK